MNWKILITLCLFSLSSALSLVQANNPRRANTQVLSINSPLQLSPDDVRSIPPTTNNPLEEDDNDVIPDSTVTIPEELNTLLEEQEKGRHSNEEPEVLDSVLVIPSDFSHMLDYLLHTWVVENALSQECFASAEIPVFPDSIYRERLAKLPCIMEMPYNSSVKSFINLYTLQKRDQMEYMLGIGKYYFPIFENILSANDLPLELKYLPVIESALNPNAFSRMGAAGLWQFMVPTGRMYGLEINSLVDERLDPIKSTEAAVRYLKDLYAIFNDWHLVIAAYNCGPGNVRKAIRRSGGKQDYWSIYPYLPRETRGYVPIFIAATYAMEYANKHNLCPAVVDIPLVTDTVVLTQRMHLEQVASVLNVPLGQLKQLNPQYRRNIIPGTHKAYSLCLPSRYVSPFIDNYNEIVEYKADSLINNRRGEIELAQKSTAVTGSGKLSYHTVRQGQTLGHIAQMHGVSVSKLRQWNNIRGSMIRTGQRLRIYK